MDTEEESGKKSVAHEVGMVLDSLSIDELEGRIIVLEKEIVRIRSALKDKSETKTVAEAVFRL